MTKYLVRHGHKAPVTAHSPCTSFIFPECPPPSASLRSVFHVSLLLIRFLLTSSIVLGTFKQYAFWLLLSYHTSSRDLRSRFSPFWTGSLSVTYVDQVGLRETVCLSTGINGGCHHTSNSLHTLPCYLTHQVVLITLTSYMPSLDHKSICALTFIFLLIKNKLILLFYLSFKNLFECCSYVISLHPTSLCLFPATPQIHGLLFFSYYCHTYMHTHTYKYVLLSWF